MAKLDEDLEQILNEVVYCDINEDEDDTESYAESTEKITFTTDEGEEEDFYILQETTINGKTYLLIVDSLEENGAEATIIREKQVGKEEVTYDVVEDEEEIKLVSKIFEELMDIEIEV